MNMNHAQYSSAHDDVLWENTVISHTVLNVALCCVGESSVVVVVVVIVLFVPVLSEQILERWPETLTQKKLIVYMCEQAACVCVCLFRLPLPFPLPQWAAAGCTRCRKQTHKCTLSVSKHTQREQKDLHKRMNELPIRLSDCFPASLHLCRPLIPLDFFVFIYQLSAFI